MKPQELANAVSTALKRAGSPITLDNMTWAGLIPLNMTWAGQTPIKPGVVTLVLVMGTKDTTKNMTWAGAEEPAG